MSDQLTDREIHNIKYMLEQRILKRQDELDGMALDLINHQAARIAALESEREIYLSTNRAIKNYANDQETVISNQAARIAALETEIAALKNPPYRIVFNLDGWWIDGKFYPLKYQAEVMCGDHQLPFEGDWWDTEDAARAEAQQFIDKLTAPFGAKGE